MPRLDIIADVKNKKTKLNIDKLMKECKLEGVKVVVSPDIIKADLAGKSNGVLLIHPTFNLRMSMSLFNGLYNHYNYDNIKKFDIGGIITLSTRPEAQAIFDAVKSKFPNKETSISIIEGCAYGIGASDDLFGYGYTLFKFNTNSNFKKPNIIKSFASADVIIGAADENNIIDMDDLIGLDSFIIDTNNNFKIKDRSSIDIDKDKFEALTRYVIIDRVRDNALNGRVIPEDIYKNMKWPC